MCGKSAASLLGVALLALQLGATTPGARALDQLERAVKRPPPVVTPSTAPRPDQQWVPDRYIPGPDGVAHVPGHWERRVSDREVYTPPLVVCPQGGECVLFPGGVRPPMNERQAP